MKTTTILLLLPLLCLNLPLCAQIQAGDTDEVVYSPLNISYELLSNPWGNYTVLADSVDVNGDGTDDLAFGVTLSNVPDFVGGVSQVYVLHPEVEVMVTNYNVTQLQIGEPILPDSVWANNLSWTFAANFIGFAGPTAYGEWLEPSSGYMAFRYLLPGDTLYGWFDVFAESGETFVKLKVYGFGIESGINGTKDVPEGTVAFFPNPVSGLLTIPPGNYAGIEILAADGRCVRSYPAVNTAQIDLSGLPMGVYQVVLRRGRELPLTGRVVVGD